MKHIDRIDEESIAYALDQAGISVSSEQAELLCRHAQSVLEVNVAMNLTRITAPDAFIWLHIVDSLAFLRHVALDDGASIDVGTGAGFPGIPLAILGHRLDLCESVRKKAAFLEQCVGRLGLDVRVFAVRAEELVREAPRSYQQVIMRAVSSLPALVELASPMLVAGGRLVAMKGAPPDDEVSAAEVAATVCGMRHVDTVRYKLPAGESRSVWVYERVAEPQIELPRRPGAAQHQPLGVAKG